MEADSPDTGGTFRPESGLARSIRSLFQRVPQSATSPVRAASRGSDPRDLLTTLCARYIRGRAEVREQLVAGILEQAAVLRERGELQVLADAAVAVAHVELEPPNGGGPRLAAELVDPRVAPLLAERLASESDPAVRRVLEAILRGSAKEGLNRPGRSLPGL